MFSFYCARKFLKSVMSQLYILMFQCNHILRTYNTCSSTIMIHACDTIKIENISLIFQRLWSITKIIYILIRETIH